MATITELFEEYALIMNDDCSTEEEYDRGRAIEAELKAIGGNDLLAHLDRHAASERFGRVYTGMSYDSPHVDYAPKHTYLITKAGKMHGQSQKAFKLRLQKRAAN